ncbi:hypothetical protein TRFO_26536 [Tritrichomonas foetus]|uniref:Uncharacterized protein n=1 Tax=Tritrichomonas foetus TaxID=1144522 RepID=A0A1J4K479_9EUKA|nr:hypothetical protein TRFO_26536 [Tritrichomonas foetus]|eukprot:OHT05648.1 hypothetical protein TRFO_26536 [Tritrichomonas foetus]
MNKDAYEEDVFEAKKDILERTLKHDLFQFIHIEIKTVKCAIIFLIMYDFMKYIKNSKMIPGKKIFLLPKHP